MCVSAYRVHVWVYGCMCESACVSVCEQLRISKWAKANFHTQLNWVSWVCQRQGECVGGGGYGMPAAGCVCVRMCVGARELQVQLHIARCK